MKFFALIFTAVILPASTAWAGLPTPGNRSTTSRNQQSSYGVNRSTVNAGVDFGPQSSSTAYYGYQAYDPRMATNYYGFQSAYPNNYSYSPYGMGTYYGNQSYYGYGQQRQKGSALGDVIEIFTAEGGFAKNIWATFRDSLVIPMGDRLIQSVTGQFSVDKLIQNAPVALAGGMATANPYQWMQNCNSLIRPWNTYNTHGIPQQIFQWNGR